MLVKLPEVQFIDDKEGKPIDIQMNIGRCPVRGVRQLGWRPADARRDDSRQRRAILADRSSRRRGTRVGRILQDTANDGSGLGVRPKSNRQ